MFDDDDNKDDDDNDCIGLCYLKYMQKCQAVNFVVPLVLVVRRTLCTYRGFLHISRWRAGSVNGQREV